MKSKASLVAPNESLLHLQHQGGQCADKLFLTEVNGVDLTARQLVVVSATAWNEGCSQTRLVEVTGIDRSTMVDSVRRLLVKGLLQQRSREDARAYVVRLANRGNDALANTRSHVDCRAIMRAIELFTVPPVVVAQTSQSTLERPEEEMLRVLVERTPSALDPE